MRIAPVLSLTVLLLGSQPVLAQATLGELLEQGGKRLDKAEVQALLVGATLSGPTTMGGDVRLEVKADGSVSGNIRGVRSYGVMGTWKLEDDARFCTDLNSVGARPTQLSSCNHYYRRGNDYFAADAASTPDTQVRPRQVSR
ncbi:hypothetical protein [Zoogloea sp.]|jgi:hypothetical protein|uniref:hypothetical protein n=1 Tax=Zoogloea sp. TaxID=49181 RepID=UPI0025D6AEA8|nr:hypothetical protein [Zoogloea sp.]MCK6393529.1 hypothetical protein [Zoogloea sp.]